MTDAIDQGSVLDLIKLKITCYGKVNEIIQQGREYLVALTLKKNFVDVNMWFFVDY